MNTGRKYGITVISALCCWLGIYIQYLRDWISGHQITEDKGKKNLVLECAS